MNTTTYLASKPRYEILDGLRGVAAMIVVAYHLFETYSADPVHQILNHGYLAVDFFFVLSGFVIGYAYDDRWDTFWGPASSGSSVHRWSCPWSVKLGTSASYGDYGHVYSSCLFLSGRLFRFPSDYGNTLVESPPDGSARLPDDSHTSFMGHTGLVGSKLPERSYLVANVGVYSKHPLCFVYPPFL